MAGQNVYLENIIGRILLIRNQRVIMDADLAGLYGVPTKRLNEQVKRNKERFPEDFMFQLTLNELANLRSQNATSSWGGTRHLPFVFTEHGALMAANVLNSPEAVEMSVFIVRAFISLRKLSLDSQALYSRIIGMERKYDARFREVFSAIKQLMEPPETKKNKIGFVVKSGKE
jgi:hypothetical protein